MAKGIYVGFNNVAHKVKKIYVGYGGVAHKVKKIYVGVGGVARLVYSGDPVSYAGTTTGLQLTTYHNSGANVGSYSVFAGGQGSTRVSSTYNRYTVDAYNASGARTACANMVYWRYDPACACSGTVFHVIGGQQDYFESYNSSLTKLSNTQDIGGYTTSSYGMRSGGYAMRIGGSNGGRYTNTTVAINDSLTKTSGLHSIKSAAISGATMNIGGTYKGIAAGGWGTVANNYVGIYNGGVSASVGTALSVARGHIGTAASNSYALFAGGQDGNYAASKVVDAYNSSFTRSLPSQLTTASSKITGAYSNGIYMFFGASGKIDIYDAALTHVTDSAITALPAALSAGWALANGNTIFHAGGSTGGNDKSVNTVYMYRT